MFACDEEKCIVPTLLNDTENDGERIYTISVGYLLIISGLLLLLLKMNYLPQLCSMTVLT